jgi:hypothetical protein
MALLHTIHGFTVLVFTCNDMIRIPFGAVIATLMIAFKWDSITRDGAALRLLVYAELPIWFFNILILKCIEAPFGAEKLWFDPGRFQMLTLVLLYHAGCTLCLILAEKHGFWTLTTGGKPISGGVLNV